MSDLPDNVVFLADFRKRLKIPQDAILEINFERDEITFRLSALFDKINEVARLNGDKFPRYKLTNPNNGYVHIFENPISLMMHLQTFPEIAKGIANEEYTLEELVDS
jgi:hypothetical protein